MSCIPLVDISYLTSVPTSFIIPEGGREILAGETSISSDSVTIITGFFNVPSFNSGGIVLNNTPPSISPINLLNNSLNKLGHPISSINLLNNLLNKSDQPLSLNFQPSVISSSTFGYGQFLIPSSGYYFISATISITNNNKSGSLTLFLYNINNSGIILPLALNTVQITPIELNILNLTSSFSGTIYNNLSTLVYLNANNRIFFATSQNTNSPLISTPDNRFLITRLLP